MTLLPEVQKHYGKLKLYINGNWVDSESERVCEVQQLGAGVHVRKPYTLEALAVAVREELDRSAE